MKTYKRIPQDDQYVTGKDYAARDFVASHTARIQKIARARIKDGTIDFVPTGKVRGVVQARIDFERWIADCPDANCSGAEMVELDEPVMFCLSCGNAANKGDYYEVEFPKAEARAQIYDELEQRPLLRPPNTNKIMRAERSRGALHPMLTRSWRPDEKVSDLKLQRQHAENTMKARKR